MKERFHIEELPRLDALVQRVASLVFAKRQIMIPRIETAQWIIEPTGFCHVRLLVMLSFPSTTYEIRNISLEVRLSRSPRSPWMVIGTWLRLGRKREATEAARHVGCANPSLVDAISISLVSLAVDMKKGV